MCGDARAWAGGDFKAGYHFRAGSQSTSQLLATMPPAVPGAPNLTAALAPDWACGGVERSGHTTLFGRRRPIVDGGLVAQHAHPAAWADVTLAVLGVTLYEREVDTLDINKSYARVLAARQGARRRAARAVHHLGVGVGVGQARHVREHRRGLGNLPHERTLLRPSYAAVWGVADHGTALTPPDLVRLHGLG